MGFVDDPQMVRVDLFRTSGKWITTLSIRWDRFFVKEVQRNQINNGPDQDSSVVHDGQITTELIHDTFRRLIREQRPNFEGHAICLKPYHENAHPLMITFKEK